MDYITDQALDRIAGDTGALLRAEQKVRLVLRAGGRPWEGGINGHFFRIPRGVEVEVPHSIAELIRENEQVELLSARSLRPYRGKGKKLSE